MEVSLGLASGSIVSVARVCALLLGSLACLKVPSFVSFEYACVRTHEAYYYQVDSLNFKQHHYYVLLLVK